MANIGREVKVYINGQVVKTGILEQIGNGTARIGNKIYQLKHIALEHCEAIGHYATAKFDNPTPAVRCGRKTGKAHFLKNSVWESSRAGWGS